MSIFGRIKDAIFGGSAHAAPAPATPAIPMAEAAPQPAPVEVDVAATLGAMPGADGLNWRGSIVDLLKLIGVEASYDNRKELAGELGNPGYSGSAEDNIALHKQVMNALAENGGKVPAELLD